jgi:hypothetical protein
VSPTNGTKFTGAQMLMLLGWSALKRVWNKECFVDSTPKHQPHRNAIIATNTT